MIFEITKLSIDEQGHISEGGDDLTAYKFNNPLIEASNGDIKTFLLDKEFNDLNVNSYETAIFYCVQTKCLYVNVINWYRKNTSTPLDTKENFSAILSSVEVTYPVSRKPEKAFAKIMKEFPNGLYCYLTCPYALHKDYDYYSDNDPSENGDLLAHFGDSKSRIIDKSFTPVEVPKYTDIVRKLSLPVSFPSILRPYMSFYISKVGKTISPKLVERYATGSGNAPRFLSSINLITGNYGYIGNDQVSDEDGNDITKYNCPIFSASNSAGDHFCLTGTHSIQNYKELKPFKISIKEFDSYSELATYLSTKYKPGMHISAVRCFVSDYYSEKECINLIGIEKANIKSYIYSQLSFTFLDKLIDPFITHTIWQKKSAYVDMMGSKDAELYVINEPTDFKEASTGDAGYSKESELNYTDHSASCFLNPNDFNKTQSRHDVYNSNENIWIPNSNINKILHAFAGVEIYSSRHSYDRTSMSIYNGSSADISGYRAFSYDKNTFVLTSIPEMSSAENIKSKYFVSTITDSNRKANYGPIMPVPLNAPTKIDDIDLNIDQSNTVFILN